MLPRDGSEGDAMHVGRRSLAFGLSSAVCHVVHLKGVAHGPIFVSLATAVVAIGITGIALEQRSQSPFVDTTSRTFRNWKYYGQGGKEQDDSEELVFSRHPRN